MTEIPNLTWKILSWCLLSLPVRPLSITPQISGRFVVSAQKVWLFVFCCFADEHTCEINIGSLLESCLIDCGWVLPSWDEHYFCSVMLEVSLIYAGIINKCVCIGVHHWLKGALDPLCCALRSPLLGKTKSDRFRFQLVENKSDLRWIIKLSVNVHPAVFIVVVYRTWEIVLS